MSSFASGGIVPPTPSAKSLWNLHPNAYPVSSKVATGYKPLSNGSVTIPASAITNIEITGQDSYFDGYPSRRAVTIELIGPAADHLIEQIDRQRRGEPSVEQSSLDEIKGLQDELLRMSRDLAETKAREADQRERALSWKQVAEDLDGELSILQASKES